MRAYSTLRSRRHLQPGSALLSMGRQAGVEARLMLHHHSLAVCVQLDLVYDAPHPAALHQPASVSSAHTRMLPREEKGVGVGDHTLFIQGHGECGEKGSQ